MSCNNAELACKPFAPLQGVRTPNVYGVSGPCRNLANAERAQCDGYFKGQCAQFHELMHGLRVPNPCGNCFGNIDHKEYICPKIGCKKPRGYDCFGQPPSNLSEHYICESDNMMTTPGCGISSPGFSSKNCGINGRHRYSPPLYTNTNTNTNVPVPQPVPASLVGATNPNVSPSMMGGSYQVGQAGNQMGGGQACGSPITSLNANNQNQSGGAFSILPSALDVDINDPVYNRCETVVHLKPSYLDGPTYGNLADSCGLRTNYRPSKQPGLDVSLVRGPGLQTGPLMETSLCGDRQRCGNGACAPTQNPVLNQSNTGCKRLDLPRSCSWDDRALTSPWVYGQATNDIPTWYNDLSGETVGARPQWRAGTNNSVPPMMLINQTNFLGSQFGCRQPCWQTNCL